MRSHRLFLAFLQAGLVSQTDGEVLDSVISIIEVSRVLISPGDLRIVCHIVIAVRKNEKESMFIDIQSLGKGDCLPS